MSSAGFGSAVGDADQFLVDFEQKRYDDGGSEREVDALAAMASSDSTCQLRSELESHAANQSSQATAAKKQRDAALQVRSCHITPCLHSQISGTPCQARSFKESRQMKSLNQIMCHFHAVSIHFSLKRRGYPHPLN
jgi:hypothetical protein